MEVIAAIHARIVAIRSEGREPDSVILPNPVYRMLQRYRAELGETEIPSLEYLGKYEIFGLPIFTDERNRITVRSKHKM